MDESYVVIPGAFEMEAAHMELEVASDMLDKLVRLSKDGFGATQMALDLAIEAKSRISRMCLLMLKTGAPEAVEVVKKALVTIRELDKVILNIKQAMGES